jgi:hypothetical protein
MTSSLVNDRMQSSRTRSKRKLQSVALWTSLRSRSRSMRKQNRRLSRQRSEISISIVFQILERQIFLKRLISIRLKKNLWKRKNALIATNRIISTKIAQNSESSELSRWTWEMIMRNREKVIFVKDVTKTKNLIISSFFIKNDLFDETFVLINCVLKNKIFTITMINIDVTEYAFVDETVAQ